MKKITKIIITSICATLVFFAGAAIIALLSVFICEAISSIEWLNACYNALSRFATIIIVKITGSAIIDTAGNLHTFPFGTILYIPCVIILYRLVSFIIEKMGYDYEDIIRIIVGVGLLANYVPSIIIDFKNGMPAAFQLYSIIVALILIFNKGG